MGLTRSRSTSQSAYFVLFVDGGPPLGVVRVQLGVLSGEPQQHPSLQVHPELGTQVLLRSLPGGYAWGQVWLARPCPPEGNPSRLLLGS